MGTALKDLKAPPGVSKDELYRKVITNERKDVKDKVMVNSFYGKLTNTGVGLGTAAVTGAILGNWPRLASFDAGGKVKTLPIFGAAALVGGFLTDGLLSEGLLGAGAGMTLPFIFSWGVGMGPKIPGGV